MVNQKYLDKAETLIEALPYIQRFNRKIVVVKYGGSAMVDEKLKKQVIQDVTLLKLVGFKPIIVHGGGKEISKWVAKSGKEPEFVNGLRKTDADTMEIAEMVLNRVNKSLVSIEQLTEEYDIKELRSIIEAHVKATGSARGRRILEDFDQYVHEFKKIVPRDYSQMLESIAALQAKGMPREQAEMEAFKRTGA